MSTAPDEPIRETPRQVRMTLIVLSVGLGLLLLFAYLAETAFDRAQLGALFFIVPVLGCLIPMVLASSRLPKPARGPAMLLSAAAALIAIATLVVGALLQPLTWITWVIGAVLAVAVGLAAAASTKRA